MTSASCARPLNACARASMYMSARIARRPGLDGPPRQIDESLVVLTIGRREREVPAGAPFLAARRRLGGRTSEERPRVYEHDKNRHELHGA